MVGQAFIVCGYGDAAVGVDDFGYPAHLACKHIEGIVVLWCRNDNDLILWRAGGVDLMIGDVVGKVQNKVGWSLTDRCHVVSILPRRVC